MIFQVLLNSLGVFQKSFYGVRQAFIRIEQSKAHQPSAILITYAQSAYSLCFGYIEIKKKDGKKNYVYEILCATKPHFQSD